MSRFDYNDSVLASYEGTKLNPDNLCSYDSRARHSLKERIKALEAVVESFEDAENLDDDQRMELESSREELHDLRTELNML